MLATVIILIAVVGALYYVFGGPTAQQRRASRFGAEGPVPVLVVRRDARGRAGLSRRRRHDQGAQHRHRPPAGRRQAAQRQLQGRRGRQERRRAGADRSRHLPGAARPGRRQEGAGRGAARQLQDRSRALRKTRRDQRDQQAAGRHATRAGGAEHRAGAGRSGRNRQRAGDARLHHHYRADRRPHRHPHGGRRQLSCAPPIPLRNRSDHPAAADLGAVQSAAAGPAAGEHRLRQGAARRRCAALGQ